VSTSGFFLKLSSVSVCIRTVKRKEVREMKKEEMETEAEHYVSSIMPPQRLSRLRYERASGRNL